MSIIMYILNILKLKFDKFVITIKEFTRNLNYSFAQKLLLFLEFN